MGTINFIHPAFRPKVVCDKLCADGHEAVNLVAAENYIPPGLLVESFIRTPVKIYFTFPCNIDIERVILHGSVGAQKSNSYKISSWSAKRDGASFAHHWETSIDQAKVLRELEKHEFTPIGDLWQKNTEAPEVVSFYNPCFTPRLPCSELTVMPTRLPQNQPLSNVEMRTNSIKNLSSVSYLLICITKTTDGSVPALRWVEVWGQPSASCPKEELDQILSAHNSVCAPRERLSSINEPKKPENIEKKRISGGSLSQEVPLEFCDALTYEIMAQPMLLPSGQYIDQSTLEKCQERQAQVGQVPSDPFTGRIFTDYCKPVPNLALKVRIDHYLMTSGGQVSAGRTVGKSVDVLTEKRTGGRMVQTSRLLGEMVPSQTSAPRSLYPDSVPEPAQPPVPKSVSYSVPKSVPHPVPHSVQNSVPYSIPQSVLQPVPKSVPDSVPDSVPRPVHSVPHPIPRSVLHSVPDSESHSVHSVQMSLPHPVPHPVPHSVPNPELYPGYSSSSGNRAQSMGSSTKPSHIVTNILSRRSLDVMASSLSNISQASSNGSSSRSLLDNTHSSTLARIAQKKRPTTQNPPNTAKRTRSVSAASPSAPAVIDLTSESDTEDAMTSSQMPHAHSSVIRRNPRVSREQDLKNSLDNALNQTMSSLPSFLSSPPRASSSNTPSSPPVPKKQKLECIFCTLYREVDMMYSLGCNDVACRDCLSCRRKTGTVFCDKCGQTSLTKSISKVHL